MRLGLFLKSQTLLGSDLNGGKKSSRTTPIGTELAFDVTKASTRNK
jgi:hypothetical protein